jgi:hypothetical protein
MPEGLGCLSAVDVRCRRLRTAPATNWRALVKLQYSRRLQRLPAGVLRSLGDCSTGCQHLKQDWLTARAVRAGVLQLDASQSAMTKSARGPDCPEHAQDGCQLVRDWLCEHSNRAYAAWTWLAPLLQRRA